MAWHGTTRQLNPKREGDRSIKPSTSHQAKSDGSVGYHNPLSRTSRTPGSLLANRFSARGTARRLNRIAGRERLDYLEVGHQVGLFILFDGSSALRQPPPLEIGPGSD